MIVFETGWGVVRPWVHLSSVTCMGRDDGPERSARSCNHGPSPIRRRPRSLVDGRPQTLGASSDLSYGSSWHTQLYPLFRFSYRGSRSFFPRDLHFLLLLLYLSLTRPFPDLCSILCTTHLYQLNIIQSFLLPACANIVPYHNPSLPTYLDEPSLSIAVTRITTSLLHVQLVTRRYGRDI